MCTKRANFLLSEKIMARFWNLVGRLKKFVRNQYPNII